MITEKLAQIERFLGQKGITLQRERRPPLDATAITKAERTLGHSIPEDLRDMYARFADGFEVFWKDVRSHGFFISPGLACPISTSSFRIRAVARRPATSMTTPRITFSV